MCYIFVKPSKSNFKLFYILHHFNHKKNTEPSETFSLGIVRERLPRELQKKIIHTCLQIDPSARYHFQRVNPFFEDVVQEISPPSIYIRPTLFQTVPHHLTVSEIADEAGIQSELVQELKWIFKNRNWLNVGLCLQPVRHNWFKIVDI